jgi:hypothetical protein
MPAFSSCSNSEVACDALVIALRRRQDRWRAVTLSAPHVWTAGKPIAVLPRLARQIRKAARSTGFGRFCRSIPSDRAYDRAACIHAADHDHGTGELRIGDRLQYLNAVAVAEHQVQRHVIEPSISELRESLRAGLRHRDGMAGLVGCDRNQASLRGIVVDDQELQRAPCLVVWRIGRNWQTDWHRWSQSATTSEGRLIALSLVVRA